MTASDIWTKDDAVAARDFFGTQTWSKILQIMQVRQPKIAGKDRDERFENAIRRETWENCLNSFAAFTQDVIEDEEFEQPDMSTLTGKH
jgi:hypothetical protein